MLPPLMFMPNQAPGSEAMVGPKEGAKTYCVARHPLPAPNCVELYQYGQMSQSSASAQGPGIVLTVPGPEELPVVV
jgi:hypothetical protein